MRTTWCGVLNDPLRQVGDAAQAVRFVDRAPWWGGDLQTLRNVVMRRMEPLPGRTASLEFAMPDGSGDRLLGT
ncbi:MAG: hypothetical protein AAF967_08060, partial [Pseudomonadota bacterium]